MSNVKSSFYARREKIVAAEDLANRMMQRWPENQLMKPLAEQLLAVTGRMSKGYQGKDTRPVTEEVRNADESRDNAATALRYHLKAILTSEAHREMWEAGSRLFNVLAGHGLGWIHDSYNVQTLKMREVIASLESLPVDLETCQAGRWFDQLKSSQALFEEKSTSRGELQAEKPETLEKINPEFERLLRSTLLLLEGCEDNADRAFILEPFTRLQRKYGGAPASPEPSPSPSPEA